MTDTATADRADDDSPLDPPAAGAAVTKIPYSTVTAGWLNLFAPLVLVSLALSVIALIVAINADGTTVVESGEPAEGAAASTEVTADLGEFFIEFDAPSIAADTDVALTMDNVGAIVHNLAVLQAGADPADESRIEESMIISRFDDIPAGESLTGSLNLDPATYLVVCLIPGHFNSGMSADLTAAAA